MHLCTLAILIALGQSQADGDSWPQWRGPTADSVSPTADLPFTWSAKENITWKTKIPGWGTSTPAIWKDAIYLTTQVNDKDLVFLRLDRKTGAVVWEKKVGEASPRRKGPVGVGRFHDEHNMASPSPVTDGEHVWVHFGEGTFACFKSNGDEVWSNNLSKKYGVYSIWWGHANSPLIVGDLIISVCVQDPKGGGKSYVVAHEKATGKERWMAERVTGAMGEPADSYTTPLLYKRDGRAEVIIFGGNVLDAYELETGKRLWSFSEFNGNRVIAGPTLIGNRVYAVQGMRGPLFAVGVPKSSEPPALNWKYKGATPDSACPVEAGGFVYMANNDGSAVCVDAKDGKPLWKERLSEAFRATPLVAGNRVYFVGKDGRTTIVEAGSELKILARNELDEEIMASPAVAGRSLFLRTKSHLIRIDGKSTAK